MAQQVVISFNANANFSDLIGEVRRANAEIATLQTQLNGLGSSAYGSLNNLNKQFIEGMRNSRLWSSTFVDVTNETREFGRHLDQGRLKLKDYFREFSTQVRGQRGMIRRLAEEQVKLQRSILTTTVGPQGEARNILSTPTGLDRLDPSTMKALRAEQFKIIGRSVQGVSTELINLGKNTQWAGRQLTVGLTVPLTIFAAQAATAFKEVDQQLTRLAKVYGDIGGATASEIASIKKETADLAKTLASSLGASATETIGLAADIAATGKTGSDLLQSVTETTRLAVLGEVDRQAAMSATLSLQSAFNLNTQELAQSINFLNAVENQTSTSLADLVEAIPKAGPVVRQLGGDVKDLALFLTAMREGGINASEGANALKSGLASIINPTQKTRELMSGFGIDIQNIVNKNAGDLVGTVTALKDALNELNPLARAQAIEQIFGKFQFARMSALFDNLGKSGSQTVQVMKLMGASTADLAAIADRELTTLTESASGKFARQMESLKANMALAGEGFLGIFSKVLGGINKILEGFNRLPDGAQTALTIIGAIVGLAGPLIMLSGVFLNFIGYVVKSIGFLGRLFTSTKKFEMLDEQLVAVKLSGDKMASNLYDQAQAAKVAEAEISRLVESLKRLIDVQEAGKATQGATAVTGARGYVPKMIFDPKEGRMPGSSEFSHFKNVDYRKELQSQFGISESRAEMLKTLGTNIPSVSIAAKFQQAMGKNMPNTIVPDNTTVDQMQAMLANVARTTRQKDALSTMMTESKNPQAEISSLFVKESDYAKIKAKHIANMKVIAAAYDKSAAYGNDMALQIQKAIQEGGPTAGIAKVKEFAVQLGIDFEQLVSENTDSILAAIKAEGPDAGIDTAVKAEIQAVGTSLDGLKVKAQQALFSISDELAQGSVYLEAASAKASVAVDTGVKKIGTVTVELVDGIVRVISKAGNELKSKAVMNNPKVKAAIEKLKQEQGRLNQEVTNDIISAATAEGAAATALAADNGLDAAQAQGRGAKGMFLGRMKGMFTGRAGLGSSMAMMGLGMATSMMPTGTGGDIAGGAMMGASMGMMFGAPGAAVGAALGALIPASKALWGEFDKLRNIARLVSDQYKVDKEYARAAGLNLKTIADIQLQQLTGKTEEAASALEMLAKAALEANIATSTGKLREKTKKADSFKDVQAEYENLYLSYVAAGASEETAKIMMAAILKAAGKEGFTTDLRMALAQYAGKTQSEATVQQFQNLTGGGVKGTAYEAASAAAVKAGNYTNEEYMTKKFDEIISKGQTIRDVFTKDFFTEDQIRALEKAFDGYLKLTDAQKAFVNGTMSAEAAVNILDNALSNQDLETFEQTMQSLAQSGMVTGEVVSALADKISGLGQSEKNVLKAMTANGVDAATQMQILRLRTDGVIQDIEALSKYDNAKIKIYVDYLVSEQKAKEAADKAKSIIDSYTSPSSGGGGGDNSAAKKALEARLKALQEEERVEKNIAKIKELQLKYEEKRRSLALDYLSAISSGDMEGALRAQVQMEAESARFIKEKADTQKEIARDDEKAKLQAQIDALSAGSSAVKGVSDTAKKVKDELNSTLDSIVSKFGAGGDVTKALSSFADSPELAKLKKSLKNLGFSDADITSIVESLRARIEAAVKGAINNATQNGTGVGNRTKANPEVVTGYTPEGFRYKKGDDTINVDALSDTQKRSIVYAKGYKEGDYFTVQGPTGGWETYKVGSDGSAVRQKNAQGKWMGGQIKGYASGGYIGGFGSSVGDNIPIMASSKEFMMSARAVSTYGVANMERLNNRLVNPSVFSNNSTSSSSGGDVLVNINSINITEPGCTSDEIIAKIKKDLGAAVKRTTDSRYLAV